MAKAGSTLFLTSIAWMSMAGAPGAAFGQTGDAQVSIARDAQGVPHITAGDERSLAYGLGYSYAQDNLCLLAQEIVTVNGERARYFGSDAKTPTGLSNEQSDVFYRWLNSPGEAARFWHAQESAPRDLLGGYAAGYNRYLADTPRAKLPAACAQAAWLRPITEFDMVKLLRRLTVEAGTGHFAQAIVGARPPDANAAQPRAQDASTRQAAAAMTDWENHAQSRGSNAIALGKDAAAEGSDAILLGNPHFPWRGGQRFYQVRLTIPGKLDVAGASLAGVPAVNIGFNRHIAWTHTVDTSKHFVVYRFPLDPKTPGHYLSQGRSLPLEARHIRVPVQDADGTQRWREHTVYMTELGPVMSWPGVVEWGKDAVYAIFDPNLDNDRALAQWYDINRASSAETLRHVVQSRLGIPWVNTVAVDAAGAAVFMNVSVVPGLSAAQLQACTLSPKGSPLPVLDGSRQACAPQNSPDAPQPGALAGRDMPVLQRADFVQNSNDSAWLANPEAPLTGFTPLISQEGQPLGGRARYALGWLERNVGENGVSPAQIQGMVLSDHVGAADAVLDDLLAWCGQHASAAQAACAALVGWNRTADLTSGAGYFYFDGFMTEIAKQPGIWAVPFNPAQAATTPHGLNWQDPKVSAQIEQALSKSSAAVAAAGITATDTLGQVQGVQRGQRWIPIPGGPSRLGVYNAIESVPSGQKRREVVAGTSYLQVVSFASGAPTAWTLLAYSQSTDPASPYYRNQTEAFSRKQWNVQTLDEPAQSTTPAADAQVLRLDTDAE